MYLVFRLQAVELTPADVLLGFRGGGVFFAFQPETKPIDGSLLRSPSFPGLHGDVFRIWKVDTLHGFPQSR